MSRANTLRKLAGSLRRGTKLTDERVEVAAGALEWVSAIAEDFSCRIEELREYVEGPAQLEPHQKALVLAQLRGALMARTEDLRFRYLESLARSLAPDRRPGQRDATTGRTVEDLLGRI